MSAKQKEPSNKVLIANRGEIAIRLARAARALRIPSVAIYSRADAMSLHTRAADVAVELPGTALEAYLDIESIIATAKQHDCTLVHPGYGFLSENADFADACEQAGMTFVGPSTKTLKLFGDKVAARQLALELDIPVVPGTAEALTSATDAAEFAADAGMPIMLKAAGGGGGRGMRAVHDLEELPEAFERCRGEASAAFDDERIFAEKLLMHPRHIEVQILGDQQGDVVHLHERDCSVQQRHQKVVEIAPAPNLTDTLRDSLTAAAIKLADATNFVGAGTVEFLIDTASGEYFFIECNPRIQVEHTVTEAVTGVDLVEAQFGIALGASLASLGLTRASVPAPRGYAIQARVTTQGTGTITAYKEPSGPGIRVDGYGYVGFSCGRDFDPLLAKVICHTHQPSLQRAAIMTRHAISEFQIEGVPNNLPQLQRILDHPDFLEGAIHTAWLETLDGGATVAPTQSVEFLNRQAQMVQSGALSHDVEAPNSGLTVPRDKVGVEAPMAGTVLEISAAIGATVSPGTPLMVISAMKMEAAITAPVNGVITTITDKAVGDSVDPGEVVALIQADASDRAGAGAHTLTDRDHSWQPTLDEVDKLKALALTRFDADSNDPGVVRQRNRGKLTCRERIDLLLDDGSFREVGSLAGFASYDLEGNVDAFTPANHVGGWGTVDTRTTVVCADDFTSRGGHADGAIGAKSMYLDRLSVEMRVPSVRLLDGSSGGGSVAAMVPQQQQKSASDAKESTGAITAGRPRVAGTGGSFLPGHLGSAQYTEQLSSVPVVNLLLGSVVGIGAAKAVLGHFSVMVRDIAQLFVAGPPVVSHAMGYDITKEELGGWHIHCTNGAVDNLAETESDAFAQTKRFLSYLPSSVYEAPPVAVCADPPERSEEELLTIIPRKRTSTFDVRRVIRLLADEDSFFEIGALWGRDQVTGLVRFNGHPLGVIASDSRHENGGALTADGCDKLRRHLDLCDTFHIPVLNLVDNPGFAVGVEHEVTGTIRKGGEWMVAFAQVRIPIFTVVMRRSFGVAGNNYATPLNRPAVRIAWPAADVGGIPPEGGIEAAYKRQLAEAADPKALRAELEARIESARGPVGPLNKFQIEEMVDPRHTRRLVCEWVANAYKLVAQPDHLGPRAIQFRP